MRLDKTSSALNFDMVIEIKNKEKIVLSILEFLKKKQKIELKMDTLSKS